MWLSNFKLCRMHSFDQEMAELAAKAEAKAVAQDPVPLPEVWTRWTVDGG